MNIDPETPQPNSEPGPLDGALRRAVDEIRADAAPPDAMNQAIERACWIRPPALRGNSRFTEVAMVVGGLAAALLLAVLFFSSVQRKASPLAYHVSTGVGGQKARHSEGVLDRPSAGGDNGGEANGFFDTTVNADPKSADQGQRRLQPAERRSWFGVDWGTGGHAGTGGGDAGQLNGIPVQEGTTPTLRGLPEEDKAAGDPTPAGRLRTVVTDGLLAPRKREDPRSTGTVTWRSGAHPPSFARVYVGDGNSLELVSLQVTVTIEGPRARTLVDHIFRNPHNRQLEGTFEYPLPTGASPSYFAMFLGQSRDTVPPRFVRSGEVLPFADDPHRHLTPAEVVREVNTSDWGTLQEAHVVSKEKALETYEDVVRGRVDPALMEYAGGNTFRGRVFPIPAKGYNRVILAYDELVPVASDRVVYRFPLPNCRLTDMQFSLQADTAHVRDTAFLPKDAQREEGGGRVLYRRRWSNETPKGEVVFTCTPADEQIQAIAGRQGENGPGYLYARIRPPLTAQTAQVFANHAVFLLDTSLSEHPDRFAVSMKLLRTILESDADIKYFNVLTFNVGCAWLSPGGWLANTPAERSKGFAALDGLVLEGATDLSAALDRLAHPSFSIDEQTRVNAFLLSDGQITWGEADVASLVARFDSSCPWPTRFFCYRTGLGAENIELFEALTRRGGGIFNCFSDADVPAAARAHRTQCMQLDRVRLEGAACSDVLIAGRKAAVYPGGELIVAARFPALPPSRVIVEGTYLGQKVVQDYPVEVTGVSELAPRGWAEIAVASLLALNEPKLEPLAVAYCQQFGIAGRVASFLVLENDSLYKRFNLEEERGRTVAGDLGEFLEQAWHQLGAVLPAKEVWQKVVRGVEERAASVGGLRGFWAERLLTLLNDKDLGMPESDIRGAILTRKDVPPDYLAERDRDPREVRTYLAEARRRAGLKDIDGAVRVLSSIVEENPAREDALRLVGYRLLDLGRSGNAAWLFRQVQKQRPFEPHSYRDLARAFEESGRFALAALQYELVLEGAWHARFRDSVKQVAQEEYVSMMQEAIRQHAVNPQLVDFFSQRLKELGYSSVQSDLRVTISWNTDATDVDLWVIEPDGTKCFYQNPRTNSGGQLSQDQTQGYGPERYQIAHAQHGTYSVLVHYYAANRNLLGGETHVNVVITRFAGTPQETTERHTVILKHQNEQVEVAKIAF